MVASVFSSTVFHHVFAGRRWDLVQRELGFQDDEVHFPSWRAQYTRNTSYYITDFNFCSLRKLRISATQYRQKNPGLNLKCRLQQSQLTATATHYSHRFWGMNFGFHYRYRL
eukprot:2620937-Amphidinium_carterae.1